MQNKSEAAKLNAMFSFLPILTVVLFLGYFFHFFYTNYTVLPCKIQADSLNGTYNHLSVLMVKNNWVPSSLRFCMKRLVS